MALVVVLADGSGERAAGPPVPSPTAAPSTTPPPAPSPAGGAGSLALGITEPNPAFLVPGGPPAFAAWQDDLAAIRPSLYRLVVDWPSIAAPDGSGIDLARPQPGCMRDLGPCAGFAGVQAQLEALAAAQRAQPGRWTGMVVFTGTPDALARPARGCEREDVQPRSRPPRPGALGAYRRAVRAVLAAAARAGASAPYWSAWNEPNHPYFLSPQRARCAPDAPSLAAAPYVALARAMTAELDAAPGEQRLVLGETAGLFARRPTTTPVGAFVRALPRGLVCRAAVYGQHGYVDGEDPVPRLARVLAAFRCPDPPRIWITETGIKDASRAACEAVHDRLVRWWRDPRVDAAFQYTLREDDRFPTGLVRTDLTRAHRVLGEWKAWGARPGDGAPPPPVSCSARPAATAPGT